MLSYERLVEEAAPVGDAGRKDEDLAGIFYTGGTTGFPKGVMLPHRGLWTSAVGLQQTLSLGRDSTYLHAAPMFHLADGAISFGASLAGAAHVMIPSFDPAAALAAIEEHRVTHILLVPTMIKMVLDHPDLGRRDLSSLRQVVYGASPIPESVLGDAIRKLPNCRFTQLYGQTELSPVATELGPEYHVLEGPLAGRLRSAGRATVCTEVEIIDTEGRVVPRGTVGQITVAGPVTMLGYWNKPDETARTLVDGWVRTGDAGYMDEDGFIYVVDRVKDMIISGGENVYSAEVENALAKHPAVSGCVVIGIPSEKWGEAVHAIVILRDGQQATEADLIDHCKSLIAGYKCPRSIEFRKEPFPVSGAGKILKRELRAPYWKDASRQVN
jgi:acyl-CoA synthetase (AMP-forming)/AMP-acid ligase II